MLMTTGTGKRRVMYYVGKDKVTGSKSFSDILKNNIEVEDKELIELIYYSFENTQEHIYLKTEESQYKMKHY